MVRWSRLLFELGLIALLVHDIGVIQVGGEACPDGGPVLGPSGPPARPPPPGESIGLGLPASSLIRSILCCSMGQSSFYKYRSTTIIIRPFLEVPVTSRRTHLPSPRQVSTSPLLHSVVGLVALPAVEGELLGGDEGRHLLREREKPVAATASSRRVATVSRMVFVFCSEAGAPPRNRGSPAPWPGPPGPAG